MKSRKVLLGLIVGVCVCLAGTATAQKANFQSDKLVEIGPDNIGGRVTSLIVTGNADANPSVLYAGAATGGLYTRTDDESDIWRYIPCYLNGEELTLPISNMVRLNDSIIIVATGESYYAKGTNLKKMAALGRGIFLFNMNTESFTQMPGTNPGTNLDADFASVNDMAVMTLQGTSYLYVATPKGLFSMTMGADGAWSNGVRVFEGNVRNVIVSKQFNRAFFTVGGGVYKISDVINHAEPVNITGSCPAFGHNASAVELALAPSDESYLYAMVMDQNGLLAGLYLTRNTNSWLLISTSTVTPFSSVATSATSGAITVSPTDPTRVFMGGANVWVGKGYVENAPYQWTVSSNNELQLNMGDYMSYVYSSTSFVHSGIHQIVPNVRFNDATQQIEEGYLFATDGGVYYADTITMDTISNFNRGMNSVQITSLAVLPDGSIISGANSNACPFIESRMAHSGGNNEQTWYDASNTNTNHLANIIWKGNGGAVAASRFTQYAPLSRRTLFVSSENGSVGRSYGDYSNYTNTQTWTSDVDFITNKPVGGPAVGQISLWETDHNTASNDQMTFVIDTLCSIHRNGEVLPINSNFGIQAGDSMLVLDIAHASYPFWHVFDHNFVVKNEMRQTVHQPYLSRMLVVAGRDDAPQNLAAFYNWYPTDFRKVFDENNSDTRCWSPIYSANGSNHMLVRNAVLSQDGDCALVVVENDTLGQSYIARVHGLNDVDYTASVTDIFSAVNATGNIYKTVIDTIMVTPDNIFFGRRISSIAIDPREGVDAAIVTFDGFGSDAANVVYINNVTSNNPTINYIGLPTNVPAYSAIIEHTTGTVFVGTEDGAYTASSVNNPVWQPYGSFKGVPVTAMYQVTNNYPMITYTGHDGVTEVPYVFPHTKWANALYFGTYGRGIFMDSTYVVDHNNEVVTPDVYLGIPTVASTGNNTVRVYPNPAVDNATMELNIAQAGNVTVRLYDLTGKVVYTENLGTMAEGVHTHAINCQNFQRGMYLVNVVVGGQKATSKLIVR